MFYKYCNYFLLNEILMERSFQIYNSVFYAKQCVDGQYAQKIS